MLSDKEVRARYGADAIISRKAGFVLVHLDHPSADQVRSRTAAFEPSEYFDEDCPLCALARASGVVVFDDYPEGDDEEVWID